MDCLGRGYIRHLFPTSHSGLVFCVLNHAGLLLDYTAEPGGSPPGGELLLACGFSCNLPDLAWKALSMCAWRSLFLFQNSRKTQTPFSFYFLLS